MPLIIGIILAVAFIVYGVIDTFKRDPEPEYWICPKHGPYAEKRNSKEGCYYCFGERLTGQEREPSSLLK
jgi:hypothetical protein